MFSQIVRTKEYDINDPNNPTGIPLDLKNGKILVDNVNPVDTVGETNDYYINSTTGDLFGPKTRVWGDSIYNFDTGTIDGITNIQNVGTGEGLFKDINGNTANFKSLVGATLKIDVDDIGDRVIIDIPDAYKPSTLSRLDNLPFKVALSAGASSPDGNLGTGQAFNKGSLYIQYDNTLWVCIDPSTLEWQQLIGTDSGVNDIVNVGSGAPIYLDTVGGTARLKRLQGTTGQVLVNSSSVFETNTIEMSDSYKPVTLTNVDNVKIGYGEPAQPLGTDDVTKGYIKGSLYTEIEPGGANKIWICQSPTPAGSALWEEYSGGGGSSVKQSAMFYGLIPTVINFPDNNFNNLPISALDVDFAGGATWSAPFSGSTVVFRRGPTTAVNKRYLVNVKAILNDAAGITTEPHLYTFRMLQNPSAVTQSGSVAQVALNASSGTIRAGSCSASFIITSLTAATDEYYLQIRSSKPGSPSPAPSIDLEDLVVTFTEI